MRCFKKTANPFDVADDRHELKLNWHPSTPLSPFSVQAADSEI
jgi:hypothetical protein